MITVAIIWLGTGVLVVAMFAPEPALKWEMLGWSLALFAIGAFLWLN